MQLARSSALAEETGTALVVGGAGGRRTLDRNGDPLGFDEFMKVVQIFLNGVFNVLRLAAAATYAAAKGGIIGMTLPAARDVSVVGIRLDAAIRFQIKGSRS